MRGGDLGRWRALPRAARREVLVQGRRWHPHPDPAVQAAAVAWARRARTPAPWMLPLALLVVAAVLVGHELAVHHLEPRLAHRVQVGVVTGIALAAPVGLLYLRFSRRRCAALVEAANLRAQLARQAPEGAAPQRFLAARWPIGQIALMLGAAGLVFAVITLDYLEDPDPRLPAAVQGAAVASPLLVATLAVMIDRLRTVRGRLTSNRRGEAVWLDEEGIVLAQHGLAIGWHEIRSVDFQPLAGQAAAFPFCLALVLPPAVADAVIARPAAKRYRRRLSRALDGGDVLSIPADRLRARPEEIVTAARAYLHTALSRSSG